MYFDRIKSNAKINLALSITGKSNNLHKIETLVAFIDLYDQILIKKINAKKNFIRFCGKFSKNIKSNNTISKLFKILEQKRLIKQKYYIKINKNIPQQAGLGGGSMNAANILKYLIKKKVIFTSKKEIINIARLIGSDVILGLQNSNTILTSNNKIQSFKNCKKFYILIIKPNFGCSTKKIYSHVNEFDKIRFNNPSKKMFNVNFLKKNG